VAVVSDGLSAVFEPRRIALVGASDQPGKMGELFWRNLSSFPGEVVPVTSSAGMVGGRRTYRTLTDVDGEIDLAVVVVPAPAVPAVIRDAATKGVPAAVIITGGFAETGPDGARLQAELLTAARAGGVRVVGPNCFGVQNCDVPLNASMAAGTPEGGGGISLATQSGAYGMAIHALGLDERTRFAKVYAAGNKVDIGDAELLRYLGNDPATRTICFFLESLPDGRAFFEAASDVTVDKPVIVAKTGRSAAGARAAQSHTGAMAGSEQIWRAALDQAGVILARTGLEMMDAARALDSQPPPTGGRIAIITNSGGTGVELADLLTEEGLEVPELSAALQNELRPLLPAFASPRNPVDITPVWNRFAELYPLLVERLARSGEVDAVVPVLLQRSASDERVAAEVRDAVTRLRADGIEVPVYVCWVAPRAARGNADLLQEAGVPCFEWPERTARAIAHAVRYGRVQRRARAPRAAPDRPSLRNSLPVGVLDPSEGLRLLRDAGIPTIDSVTCAGADLAVEAGRRLGYPVVAKVFHPEILHKTDSGGVRLGLADDEALREAAGELLSLASGAQVVVQHQSAGVEVVVGGIRDPQFGPVVMVGLGGILVEVLGDVAFGLAPIDEEEARRLIASLRGHAVLAGARGREPVDVEALARVVCATSELLATTPEITELDLNPVLAGADGCVAVDWRILVGDRAGQDEATAQDSPCHDDEVRRRPAYRTTGR
jgi:acetate---CoA ligase (ADP-forming)